MMSRLAEKFAAVKAENRAALVTYFMAGDPDLTSFETLLAGLPAAGADIIEVGMPFSDPMADGPAIQAAGLRAIAAGVKLPTVLAMVERFRAKDSTTPIILMGYFNPIYHYGVTRFLADALKAGVDGMIVVDLPPEEDHELGKPARAAGLDFIRLATPTADDARLGVIADNASGFIYYVSVAGITGAKTGDVAAIDSAVRRLRAVTDLPIAVGFGIKTPERAAAVAAVADGVVVGTALVEVVAGHIGMDGEVRAGLVATVLARVAEFAAAVRRHGA
ncbi:MAG: tryptophan synthase subunit alpha [Candidatus Pacebacteria bacterium]|nr:tryptophan synthase subunit alpha [Candidatus Paceibacterota bacterium]